ncbi:MAG: hypothetical protein CL534_03165 [Ahrensia sp.]|nr:hypothetical protein [Ahrensia sp.]
MEQDFDLRAYLAIAKRRWLYFLLPAIVAIAAAASLVVMLPRSYEAMATILVESQRIPSDMVASTVSSGAAERIKVIEQRLKARDNLLDIAGKFDLYRYQGENRTPTAIVDEMRNAIGIRQIDVGRSSRNADIIGFTVSFQYRDASVASRVANELVTSILTQNVEQRLSRASETSDFFQKQLSDYEKQLLALEDRIASYKRENEASLPETLSYRRMELAQLTTQIADLDQKLRLARDGDTEALADTTDKDQLEFSLQSKQIAYDSFIEERDKLGPLVEKGFVPKQRMINLDRQIAQTEVDIASIKAKMASLGVVGNAEDNIKFFEAQRDDLSAKASELAESISKTPTVEAALAAMNRDYQNLQDEYRQTKSKLADAQTGERLEQDRQGERFEVLEQATVPTEPTKPDRKKILMAGIAGGIGLGIGLVVLLELLDGSIRTVSDLERRLQLRPIGVIPYIVTPAEKRRTRLKIAGGAVACVTIIAAGLIAVHLYYLPLDFIAEKGWQKIQARLPIVG